MIRIVGSLFVLSLITYVDRAAISSAKDAMAAELSLSNQSMGAVFSAFALGYALAQIPAGWLVDRVGPRLMLGGVVSLWSLLTALTGAVSSIGVMLGVRFLFGVAEAGAFPASARVFYNWLPSSRRGRANGIIFSGSRLGAALAFPLMAWLLANWNWRACFYLLAIPGLAWALGWSLWFRNEPPTAPHRDDPSGWTGFSFLQVFRSRVMLLAMAQYFATNFVTFLCLSWMLPYLKDRYRLPAPEAAFYAMIPLLVGATSQWVTGFVVDRLYQSRYRDWSRRLPAMIGFSLAAAGVAAIPLAPDAAVATACFAAAAFGAEITISPSWAFCMDIGGRRSGAVTGAMNMAGNLGSFVTANVFPFLQTLTGSATAYFELVAVMSVAGAVCWLGMKASGQHRA
jgi:MFS transporter, ACS family, glucarate transporter